MPSVFFVVLLCGLAQAGTDIRSIDGGVTVFLPNINDWRQVKHTPFGLRPGDKVKLKPLSKAEVVFEDGTWMRVSDDAQLLVIQDNERGVVVQLDAGKLDASVKRLHDHVFEVRAPGAKITLRADRARISITHKKVVVVEVTRGLAEVEPAVGPPVQVPDEHRLEIPLNRAPGLPVPLRESRHVIDKLPPAPPGANRKFERKRVSADPDIGVPEPTGGKPPKTPELGAESLGIAKPAPKAKDPALGLESMGLEPALGAQALGLKEPGAAAKDPALGGSSLGLSDLGPEPKAKDPKVVKKPKEPEAPRPVSTDINPAFDFQDFGVKPPKPKQRSKK